jgi:hypothetical protein
VVLRVAEGSTHKEEEEEGHNFVLTYADIVEDILCMTLISDDELISSDGIIQEFKRPITSTASFYR